MAQKRFKYRFEKVLEVKRKKEEDEKKKLAALMKQQEHERRVKAQLEQELVNVQTTLREKQANGTIQVEELRFYPGHIKNIENKIRNQELRLRELAIRIEEQKDALKAAFQERKSFEKHKEKSRETWQAELDRAEAIMLDELATIGFARNQRKDD